MRRSAAVAAATLAAVAAFAVAAPQPRAQGPEARISQARGEASELARRIAAQEARVQTAAREAAEASREEGRYELLISDGRARAAELGDRVGVARGELRKARSRLRRAQRNLSDRLIAMYKGGMPETTAVLLDADGFQDLATRADYYRSIHEGDARLARRVREVRREVRDRLDSLEAAERRARAHARELEQARARIAGARRAAERRASDFGSAHREQQRRLASLRGQIDGLAREIERRDQIPRRQAQERATEQVQQRAGGGGRNGWAIPRNVVMCESGGNYRAVGPGGAGGAYQIMPDTWRRYGGSGAPQDASRAEQDRVAAQIWADSGPAAWTCAR